MKPYQSFLPEEQQQLRLILENTLINSYEPIKIRDKFNLTNIHGDLFIVQRETASIKNKQSLVQTLTQMEKSQLLRFKKHHLEVIHAPYHEKTDVIVIEALAQRLLNHTNKSVYERISGMNPCNGASNVCRINEGSENK